MKTKYFAELRIVRDTLEAYDVPEDKYIETLIALFGTEYPFTPEKMISEIDIQVQANDKIMPTIKELEQHQEFACVVSYLKGMINLYRNPMSKEQRIADAKAAYVGLFMYQYGVFAMANHADLSTTHAHRPVIDSMLAGIETYLNTVFPNTNIELASDFPEPNPETVALL